MRTSPVKMARIILNKYHPSNSWPIDLDEIIKLFDVKVRSETEMPDEVSGMIKIEPNDKAVIYINSKHHPNRKRFTLAHELGHYVLKHSQGVHVDTTLIFRDRSSGTGLEPIEIEANKFAAELLMPKELILQYYNEKKTKEGDDDILDHMAAAFKVSTTAMNYQLQNLGINLSTY